MESDLICSMAEILVNDKYHVAYEYTNLLIDIKKGTLCEIHLQIRCWGWANTADLSQAERLFEKHRQYCLYFFIKHAITCKFQVLQLQYIKSILNIVRTLGLDFFTKTHLGSYPRKNTCPKSTH